MRAGSAPQGGMGEEPAGNGSAEWRGNGHAGNERAGAGDYHGEQRAGHADDYPHGEERTGHTVATYLYRDHRGENHTKITKRAATATRPKQFPQEFWVDGRWVSKKPEGWVKIPYRLPELLAGIAEGRTILVPEGEKDVETLVELGFVATTNIEGATPLKAKTSKWTPELNKWFAGAKRVFIFEDNDEPGRKFAREKASALQGIVPDIRIVSFPDTPAGGDVSDWIKELGHSKEELVERCKAAPRWQGAGGDFSAVPLTIDEWLSRDLPPLDPLIGCVISTTVRAILAAATGLGKTNFVVALCGHAGLGKDFMHWHVPRPCKVLFIDGEMSRRLLRERIDDMARRLGSKPNNALFFNIEDIEDFAPLNTSEGQAAIWKLIEECERRLGGPLDFVCFDNIMSLIIGDMKEEDAWRDTMPLVKALTKRRIGQLWVHHTGHDASRGYGTKTREWQLDTVMHLTEVKRADTDVSFALSFPKARERTPDNRGDFAEVNIALVDDEWVSEEATGGKGKPSPMAIKFFEALREAARDSSITHINGYLIATLDHWQAQCKTNGLIDPTMKPDSARSMFSKYKLLLISANWIAANTETAWILP
jgi:5S rRNA maturation endonuclease (ribonuclease M5)